MSDVLSRSTANEHQEGTAKQDAVAAPTSVFRSVAAQRSSAASQLARTMGVWRQAEDEAKAGDDAEAAEGDQTADKEEEKGEEPEKKKAPDIQAKLAGLTRKVFRAPAAGQLPANARSTNNADTVFAHLERYCGVPRAKASERLHKIKAAAGRGGADNVLFDFSGGVYDPRTRDCIGNLTKD